MPITNRAWVNDHLGQPATATVDGTVTDIVDAPDGIGALLVITNDAGEQATSYVVPPLTPAEQQAADDARTEQARLEAEALAEQHAADQRAADAERADVAARQQQAAEDAQRAAADRRAALAAAIDGATSVDELKAALKDLLA